ncbi:MAG: hypothetical protein WC533_02585 [Candidatus Pacearchaeota archaeon]
MNRNQIVSIVMVAIFILIVAAYILYKNNPGNVDEQVAKCIGEKAVVCTQTGCHACEIQENLFGENFKYINEIDYRNDTEKICAEITATPTWIINGELYKGVKSIDELKEITRC